MAFNQFKLRSSGMRLRNLTKCIKQGAVATIERHIFRAKGLTELSFPLRKAQSFLNVKFYRVQSNLPVTR